MSTYRHKFDWFTGTSALLLTPIAAAATRLAVGWAFFTAGKGKVDNPENVLNFFKKLEIPNPEILAPVVSWAEMIGGAALVLGLMTRLNAYVLIGIMGVALFGAAHMGEVQAAFSHGLYPANTDGVKALLDISPVPYLLGVLWLAARGPGIFSIDAIINVFLRTEEDDE